MLLAYLDRFLPPGWRDLMFRRCETQHDRLREVDTFEFDIWYALGKQFY